MPEQGEQGRPPEPPGWVHVGRFDVYRDESGRLAAKPASTEEAVRAEELASALRDLQAEPDKAVAAIDQTVKDLRAATGRVEKLVELARDLANLTDPAIAAKRAEEIVARIVEDYREGRFRDVVVLVGAVLNIYLLAERWRALVALVHLDRLAAEELGDAAEAAGALNDLGALAEAAGVPPLAGGLSEQARDHLEQAGEDVAAEATGQAGGVTAHTTAHTGFALGAKVAAVAAGALVVAGGAAGFAVGDGGWYGLGSGNEAAREGGDAEVTAFAVRSDSSAAGTQDETGWSRPEDAVEPGDELDACEPLYLYAFVAFEGMVPGTEWSVEASNEGEAWQSRSGTWNSGPSYTNQFWAERGGDVIPYGSWTFVTTIGGEEVDDAEVTLVEAC